MLRDEGYIARRPRKILDISEKNLKLRLSWCNKRKSYTMAYWKKIVFTDESWLCASQFRIRFVRRMDGEDLGAECSIKQSKYHSNRKILVWAAITYDGPAALYFIDGTVNAEVYQGILRECLPDIEGLQLGKLIFQ